MSQKYFKEEEFICKCGCGQGEMNPLLLSGLEDFRYWLETPIHITSGFRCKEHNSKVGGAPNSQHLVGNAADIYVKGMSGPSLYKKLLKWNPTQFNGVGIGNTFIHVDCRAVPALFFYDRLTKERLHLT